MNGAPGVERPSMMKGAGAESRGFTGAAARKGTVGKFSRPARVSRHRHLEGEETGNALRR